MEGCGPLRLVDIHSGMPAFYLVVSTDGLAVDAPRYHGPGSTPYPGLVDVVYQSLHGTLQYSSCYCLKGGDHCLGPVESTTPNPWVWKDVADSFPNPSLEICREYLH